MQNGMTEIERKTVAKQLMCLLADTYSIYLKTQNFHWNMIGNQFYMFHKLFQTQYEELAEAVDEIAERVRALNEYVEVSFSSLQKNTCLKEEKAWKEALKMVSQLVQDHEHIAQKYRPVIGLMQEKRDEISADLLIKRIYIHEKAAYLLRSHLTL